MQSQELLAADVAPAQECVIATLTLLLPTLDPHPLHVSCNRKLASNPTLRPLATLIYTFLHPHKNQTSLNTHPTQRRLPTQFNTLFFLQTWQNIQCRRKMSWMLLFSDLPLTRSSNKFHIQTASRYFLMNFLSSFGLHYCNNTCNPSLTASTICIFTNEIF